MEKNEVHEIGVAMSHRLKDMARNCGEDTRVLQIKFAQERLLARLQIGPNKNRFVLKGGVLFSFHEGGGKRPTEDIDLHDDRNGDFRSMAKAIHMAASTKADDGMRFDLGTFKTAKIREGMRPGIRVTMDAYIGSSRVHLKLDMCSGDAITPQPIMRELPPVLPKQFNPMSFPGYPWETVMAEKLHAITAFGSYSTRMKDWYDLATIAQQETVDASHAVAAVQNTFDVRGTEIDVDPEGFTEAFVEEKSAEFSKWVSAIKAPEGRATLEQVVEQAGRLSLPVLAAAAGDCELEGIWTPEEGWSLPAPTVAM